jgi:hypothetical protein
MGVVFALGLQIDPQSRSLGMASKKLCDPDVAIGVEAPLQQGALSREYSLLF